MIQNHHHHNNMTTLLVVKVFLLLFCFVVSLSSATSIVDDTDNTNKDSSNNNNNQIITKSWTLYHNIQQQQQQHDNINNNSNTIHDSIRNDNNESFSPRAIITMKIDTTKSSSSTSPPVTFEIESVPDFVLTKEMAHEILSKPYYQLKLIENKEKNDQNDDDRTNDIADTTILTSVPSCYIRRSNYRDEIILVMDPMTGGTVLSLQYMPLLSPLAPTDCNEYYNPNSGFVLLPDTITNFKTISIHYEIATVGMTTRTVLQNYKPPQGLKVIPGTQRSGGGPNKGSIFPDDIQQPNQPVEHQGLFGFFKKYWYIIVPLMIFNLLGGGGDPSAMEQQQQQGQQQQGGHAAAAVAAGASAAAGGGGGNHRQTRRGKRD